MFTSNSATETEEAGARLATELRRGDVLALAGELGSGKTQLVKGIVRGLGSNDAVTSPTFTLVHEYSSARSAIYHFDFYRLEDADALRTIGFDEYIFGDGISIIEWADKFPRAIPPPARWINIEIVSPSQRHLDFEWPPNFLPPK